ncbi:hypothetical protein Micbo1qcDRAFT_178183 [Microdochium bolleyi]|uniref:Uncharacterized protein n=1 Tax=Microdochium bolleyi TaxID=196109 RepID=A0A136IUK8_9PEZI|nr:hypothetical protein Micbo1qcDRAFT_178183 [Microdochium bolleyi]
MLLVSRLVELPRLVEFSLAKLAETSDDMPDWDVAATSVADPDAEDVRLGVEPISEVLEIKIVELILDDGASELDVPADESELLDASSNDEKPELLLCVSLATEIEELKASDELCEGLLATEVVATELCSDDTTDDVETNVANPLLPDKLANTEAELLEESENSRLGDTAVKLLTAVSEDTLDVIAAEVENELLDSSAPEELSKARVEVDRDSGTSVIAKLPDCEDSVLEVEVTLKLTLVDAPTEVSNDDEALCESVEMLVEVMEEAVASDRLEVEVSATEANCEVSCETSELDEDSAGRLETGLDTELDIEGGSVVEALLDDKIGAEVVSSTVESDEESELNWELKMLLILALEEAEVADSAELVADDAEELCASLDEVMLVPARETSEDWEEEEGKSGERTEDVSITEDRMEVDSAVLDSLESTLLKGPSLDDWKSLVDVPLDWAELETVLELLVDDEDETKLEEDAKLLATELDGETAGKPPPLFVVLLAWLEVAADDTELAADEDDALPAEAELVDDALSLLETAELLTPLELAAVEDTTLLDTAELPALLEIDDELAPVLETSELDSTDELAELDPWVEEMAGDEMAGKPSPVFDAELLCSVLEAATDELSTLLEIDEVASLLKIAELDTSKLADKLAEELTSALDVAKLDASELAEELSEIGSVDEGIGEMAGPGSPEFVVAELLSAEDDCAELLAETELSKAEVDTTSDDSELADVLPLLLSKLETTSEPDDTADEMIELSEAAVGRMEPLENPLDSLGLELMLLAIDEVSEVASEEMPGKPSPLLDALELTLSLLEDVRSLLEIAGDDISTAEELMAELETNSLVEMELMLLMADDEVSEVASEEMPGKPSPLLDALELTLLLLEDVSSLLEIAEDDISTAEELMAELETNSLVGKELTLLLADDEASEMAGEEMPGKPSPLLDALELIVLVLENAGSLLRIAEEDTSIADELMAELETKTEPLENPLDTLELSVLNAKEEELRDGDTMLGPPPPEFVKMLLLLAEEDALSEADAEAEDRPEELEDTSEDEAEEIPVLKEAANEEDGISRLDDGLMIGPPPPELVKMLLLLAEEEPLSEAKVGSTEPLEKPEEPELETLLLEAVDDNDDDNDEVDSDGLIFGKPPPLFVVADELSNSDELKLAMLEEVEDPDKNVGSIEPLEKPEEELEVAIGPVGMVGPPPPLFDRELDSPLLKELESEAKSLEALDKPEEELVIAGPVGMVGPPPPLFDRELDSPLLKELESEAKSLEALDKPEEELVIAGPVGMVGPPPPLFEKELDTPLLETSLLEELERKVGSIEPEEKPEVEVELRMGPIVGPPPPLFERELDSPLVDELERKVGPTEPDEKPEEELEVTIGPVGIVGPPPPLFDRELEELERNVGPTVPLENPEEALEDSIGPIVGPPPPLFDRELDTLLLDELESLEEELEDSIGPIVGPPPPLFETELEELERNVGPTMPLENPEALEDSMGPTVGPPPPVFVVCWPLVLVFPVVTVTVTGPVLVPVGLLTGGPPPPVFVVCSPPVLPVVTVTVEGPLMGGPPPPVLGLASAASVATTTTTATAAITAVSSCNGDGSGAARESRTSSSRVPTIPSTAAATTTTGRLRIRGSRVRDRRTRGAGVSASAGNARVATITATGASSGSSCTTSRSTTIARASSGASTGTAAWLACRVGSAAGAAARGASATRSFGTTTGSISTTSATAGGSCASGATRVAAGLARDDGTRTTAASSTTSTAGLTGRSAGLTRCHATAAVVIGVGVGRRVDLGVGGDLVVDTGLSYQVKELSVHRSREFTIEKNVTIEPDCAAGTLIRATPGSTESPLAGLETCRSWPSSRMYSKASLHPLGFGSLLSPTKPRSAVETGAACLRSQNFQIGAARAFGTAVAMFHQLPKAQNSHHCQQAESILLRVKLLVLG